MTATETMVIIVCLVGGYWLVSYFIRDPEEMEFPAGPEVDEPQVGPNVSPDAPQDGCGFELPWNLVLGVPASATRAEIIAAYKLKISQYHPDKVANMGEEIRDLANRRSKEINAAYDAALRERTR
jgi:hypothetical protein